MEATQPLTPFDPNDAEMCAAIRSQAYLLMQEELEGHPGLIPLVSHGRLVTICLDTNPDAGLRATAWQRSAVARACEMLGIQLEQTMSVAEVRINWEDD